mmetsp:Transcript_43673/g.92920  ORF Transcript_43673/g.92920 Transcript_43673/m.92920 type:complete len:178 (-) Transcript_43673:199-732(-)
MAAFMRASLAALLAALLPRALALHTASTLPSFDSDPCPFGYGTGCGGGGAISSGTRDQVAHILEGILKNLNSHKKALTQDMSKVDKISPVSADERQEVVPTPVKHALQSLIVSLQKDGQQASAAEALSQMLAVEVPDEACEYFGACAGSNRRPIDEATKTQVADILEGIIRKLSKHK